MLNQAFRRNEDVQLEFGIAKCIKTILNNQVSRGSHFSHTSPNVALVRRAGSIYPPGDRQPSRYIAEYPTPANKEGNSGYFDLIHLRTGLPGIPSRHKRPRNSQHCEQ